MIEGIISLSNKILKLVEAYLNPDNKRARLRQKAIQYADIAIDCFLDMRTKKNKSMALLYAKKYKLIRKRFR